MSNIQPETKQQFEAVSAPEGLPPLRLRLVVGGIVTVVALTEFGASKPARADHETEEGEGKDCDYGFHARWAIDVNEDGQPGPSPEEYGCVTRKDCSVASPRIALPEGAPDLTRQQRLDLAAGSTKMQCKGDPYPNHDEWFEAHPWAQPYIEEEATTPEDSTTETEPEPVVEPTEPETTEDTTPEEVVDEQPPNTGTTTTETEPDQPEPVVEPTEPEATEDTTPEEVVDEQPPDTGTTTTETEPDQPEPVVEPTEPEATEDTTPEEVVDEQQPDTGTTTTETEPDQPEPVVEPTEPESTSTAALVEQQPPDTETDTDASVLPDVLVVGAIGAVALSSIYLFKAKKIKILSRLRRNLRR